jgi:osmotically-inducible protein OsmY
VKTDEEKQKIEKAIQTVTGVTSVENQLRVGFSEGQTRFNEKN